MELPSVTRIPVKRRRRHSSQFKAQVLQEALQPGISIAEVAQRHNLNANLIHKWRRGIQRELPTLQMTPAFIPLAPPVANSSSQSEVRIEVPGHHGSVTLFWPCDQARSLADFLKSLS